MYFHFMKTKLIFSLLAGVALLAGCGKNDNAAPSVAASSVLTVEISANDTMKFNLSRIEA